MGHEQYDHELLTMTMLDTCHYQQQEIDYNQNLCLKTSKWWAFEALLLLKAHVCFCFSTVLYQRQQYGARPLSKACPPLRTSLQDPEEPTMVATSEWY